MFPSSWIKRFVFNLFVDYLCLRVHSCITFLYEKVVGGKLAYLNIHEPASIAAVSSWQLVFATLRRRRTGGSARTRRRFCTGPSPSSSQPRTAGRWPLLVEAWWVEKEKEEGRGLITNGRKERGRIGEGRETERKGRVRKRRKRVIWKKTTLRRKVKGKIYGKREEMKGNYNYTQIHKHIHSQHANTHTCVCVITLKHIHNIKKICII